MKTAWLLLAATALSTACATPGADVRFATFNASLSRGAAGELVESLSTPDDAHARAAAEIIQRVNPDVLLINEFDYDAAGLGPARFGGMYLGRGQNDAAPVGYSFRFTAPSNTGVSSGLDLDNDGTTTLAPGSFAYARDCYGFGVFPGQYGMLLLSRHPILTDDVRTFRLFRWKDMPDARLPDDPTTDAPRDWYSAEELETLRLSSKSHWDVPIDVDGTIVHVLLSHPTPPVFDGPEDRNGARNHDEIRFWADYIDPAKSGYIYDDRNVPGGLAAGAHFVIMGDLNADPRDGAAVAGAVQQLLDHPLVDASRAPKSAGAAEQAARQGGVNQTHRGDPALDTADFSDTAAGNLRVDYVLPSAGLVVTGAGVFWPVNGSPPPSSDHRLVWIDVAMPHASE